MLDENTETELFTIHIALQLLRRKSLKLHFLTFRSSCLTIDERLFLENSFEAFVFGTDRFNTNLMNKTHKEVLTKHYLKFKQKVEEFSAAYEKNEEPESLEIKKLLGLDNTVADYLDLCKEALIEIKNYISLLPEPIEKETPT